MKSLFPLGIAAFIVGFIFSCDKVTEEEWEKKLKADGWVRENLKQLKIANTTWYGQEGSVGSAKNWILYVDKNGENILFAHNKGRVVWNGKWERGKDGTYCSQFEGLYGGSKRCGRTLWKKGEVYRWVNGKGFPRNAIWAIKKGNLENFK